ncbi:MAG: serine/threonine transporter SstT [Ruminococcaceae bacterium]|nr:serine/threonine transporter SstT [Oscillospiraceae bacterium]
MKKVLKIYLGLNLILRIAIGLVLGSFLGLFLPQLNGIGILGDCFVGCLKSIAPVLVFVLVISSIANSSGAIGRRFRTVIFLYIVSTLLAAVLAVIAGYAFPVTLKLAETAEGTAPGGLAEVMKNLVNNMISNPIASIVNANYIGILFWSVIIGISIKLVAKETTKQMFYDISNAITSVVRWIIEFAPFGILGLSFVLVSENGLGIFYDYGKLLLVLVGCMLVLSLVVNPIIVAICLKKNPYPLVLKCIRESGITAFFTRSSAANIPVNMELCRKLNLDENLYSVSIPLGATINMDGAAITITIMTLAAANTLGLSVPLPLAILLSTVATIGACGASGVAGGSLLLIPVACSLFGISNDVAMQVVGIGFIIGVVQDSLETALNSSGDVIFAATAEYMERQKKGEKIVFKEEFSKHR